MTLLTTQQQTVERVVGRSKPPQFQPEPRQPGLFSAIMVAVCIAAPMFGLGGYLVYGSWNDLESQRAAYAERRLSHERVLAAEPGPMLPVDLTAHGRDVFVSACIACHGADGRGVAGLGKDLTSSWFIASVDDENLHQFITAGRPVTDPDNTTKVAMPAKGGREDLSAQDISDVALYLRGLQDPRRMPPLPAVVALAPAPIGEATAEEKAAALAAAGGDAELAEFIAHGGKVFTASCIACHGKDARGLQGLGKDLVTSEFLKKTDDDGMLAFLKVGRSTSDPANTTKVDMPPKGGNPALSEDDLLDVVAYIRSLQRSAAAGK